MEAEPATTVVEPVPVTPEPVAVASPSVEPAVVEGKSRRGRRPRQSGDGEAPAATVAEAPRVEAAVVEEKPARTRRPARSRRTKAAENGEN